MATTTKTRKAVVRKAKAVRSEDVAPYIDTTEPQDKEYLEEEKILKQAEEISRRRLRGLKPAANPVQARRYVQNLVGNLQHEVFGVLFMNSQHQIITSEELFRGTIDSASVFPREVVKDCLKHNASCVIFYHNHPSGVIEPSRLDRQITNRLIDALALVDIKVLDHLVVSGHDSVSFAERGLI